MARSSFGYVAKCGLASGQNNSTTAPESYSGTPSPLLHHRHRGRPTREARRCSSSMKWPKSFAERAVRCVLQDGQPKLLVAFQKALRLNGHRTCRLRVGIRQSFKTAPSVNA